MRGDEICLDNRPTGSTQMFKIKARLRINTQSALKDLVIADEALCVDRPQERNYFSILISLQVPESVTDVNLSDSLYS